jgi:3'-phosphoadenosine 5'-phosphosulfate sulfotransferase (PAPS reductase)/FAD synthetase
LNTKQPDERAPDSDFSTKKTLILAVAQDMGKPRFTAAEIEQIRRQLLAQFGEHGKASADYIASVLEEAGMRVVLSKRSDTQGQYEEEFADLLHFSTLDEAEMCLVRLDELLRRFLREEEQSAAERVREVAWLGRRRAEMISRNQKVDAVKRSEKEEIARWFVVWLQTPDAFFDWLEVRKQSPDFQKQFPQGILEDE